MVSFLVLGWTGYLVLCVVRDTNPVPSDPCCATPADFGFVYEEVTFRAPDGVDLVGWYVASRSGAAVILLHGYAANRAAM